MSKNYKAITARKARMNKIAAEEWRTSPLWSVTEKFDAVLDGKAEGLNRDEAKQAIDLIQLLSRTVQTYKDRYGDLDNVAAARNTRMNKMAQAQTDEARTSNGPLNAQVTRRLPSLGIDSISASGRRLGNGWEVTFVIEDLKRWLGNFGPTRMGSMNYRAIIAKTVKGMALNNDDQQELNKLTSLAARIRSHLFELGDGVHGEKPDPEDHELIARLKAAADEVSLKIKALRRKSAAETMNTYGPVEIKNDPLDPLDFSVDNTETKSYDH